MSQHQESIGAASTVAIAGLPPEAASGEGLSLPASCPFVAPGIERSKFAAEALMRHVRQEGQGALEVPLSGLMAAMHEVLEQLHCLNRFTASLNELPEPEEGRSREVGQALLPLAVRAWMGAGTRGNEELALDLYRRQHPHQSDATRPRIQHPEWLKVASLFLAISSRCGALPGHEEYVAHSKTLRPRLDEIQEELADLRDKLSNLEARDKAASARSGQSMYADGIATLRGKVQASEKKIPELFKELGDVLVDEFSPLLNALRIHVGVHPKIAASFVEFVSNTEALLKSILTLAPAKKSGKLSFPMPRIASGKGVSVASDTAVLSAEDLQEIRRDPEKLAGLMAVYVRGRRLVREVLASAEGMPDYTDLRAKAKAALQRPFARFGAEGEQAWNALVVKNDPRVAAGALALIAEPVPGEKTLVDGAPTSEWRMNLVPLRWMVSHALLSPGQLSANPFFLELQRSKILEGAYCEQIASAQRLLRSSDYQRLVQVVSGLLDKALTSQNLFEKVAPLFILDAVLEVPEAKGRLKNQLPDAERLKKVAESIGKVNADCAGFVTEVALAALLKITPSLQDYGQDMDLSELWEIVESFKVFMKFPNILEGVAGNEGMRSGILLVGEPGVGKTHFVGCLATELGIQKFVISPDEGQVSAQKVMIDACRKIVDQAKKHAERGFAILFIDEAEIVMANRKDSRSTQEQRELTTYLLQVINEIRREHPRILIVAATNYIEEIDGGMLRDGRFDVRIEMKRPGPTMRESLMRSTLAHEGIVVDLDSQQMAELLQATEGFIPLQITRPIRDANRIGRKRKELRGEEFVMDFLVLKGLYGLERERAAKLKMSVERRKAAGDQPSVTD